MTRQQMTRLATPPIEARMDPTSADLRAGVAALLHALEGLKTGAVRGLADTARDGGGRSRR